MIRKIFISHHFDEKGKKLADFVKTLVGTHNIRPVTGERLGGQGLNRGVKDLLDQCQATIVLLTDRAEGKDNQWVTDERAYADGKNHYFITLLDEGLYDTGMYSNYERIRIKWNELHLNILDLSETIKQWKKKEGSDLKLLIQPKTLSDIVLDSYDEVLFRYKKRAVDDDTEAHWQDVKARPDPGGLMIKIPKVKDDDLIEVIKTSIAGETWSAKAVIPNAKVELKKN